MERNIKSTGDGSHTIYDADIDEPFHSMSGALQESNHVYILNGFNCLRNKNIKVLDIGFGTGLNMLLTYNQASKLNRKVHYHAVEKFPLHQGEYQSLNYCDMVSPSNQDIFLKAHQAEWNKAFELSNNFVLFKEPADFRDMNQGNGYNLVYFDAFAPEKQPELWKPELFKNIHESMAMGGIWVSYSSKGDVKRDLISVGFKVKKLPGPPGKREMIRAIKI